LQIVKTLNYLDSRFILPFYCLFMAVWVYLRHYLNLVILYATLTTFAEVGPYELNWDTEQYKCWISQYITFGLLASLQSLNLFWLFFVLRIAYNMVFNSIAEDVRSDDEESDAEIEAKQGEGHVVGISGGEGAEKKASKNGKPKGINGKPEGINGVNGKAHGGHERRTEAVSERKKKR